MQTKFSKYAMAISAMALVAFSSCTKEQSSFDVDDIEGAATIMGTCYYDAGQGYSSNAYTQLIQPAANVKVIAKVSNASLSPNGKAQGYTYFETVTDEKGAYSIDVPAVEKGTEGSTSVIISVEPFFGEYSTVKSVSNKQPIFDTKEVLFSCQDYTISVKPGNIKIRDIKYTHDAREAYGPDEYTAKFIVKVGEGRYSFDYTNDVVAKHYNVVNGKNVIAEVNGVKYGSTTNGDGEATFIIPSKSQAWSSNVNVKVEGYVVKNFTYYKREYNEYVGDYRYNTYNIAGGTYEQVDSEFQLSFSGIANDETPIAKVRMVFYPFSSEETYGYSPYEWANFSWNESNN